MSNKFFSEAWVNEAHKVEQQIGDRLLKAFKNPATFDHVLAFEVADHPTLTTHLEYVGGRSVAWTATDLFPEDQVWARFRANLEHWREAAEGKTPAANLIMAGKMRLTKGTMKAAVENAEPLNILVRSFGEVDTDWEF